MLPCPQMWGLMATPLMNVAASAGGCLVRAEPIHITSGDHQEVGEPGDAEGVEGVCFDVGVEGWLPHLVGFHVPVQEGGHLSPGPLLGGAESP